MRIRKKLIATGWDHPEVERLTKHLSDMEKRPFDGVVIEVTGRTAEGKSSALRATFSNTKWEREWFEASVDRLRSCRFNRFSDNFVSVGANPGNIDWFDDEGWQEIVEHWRIAASELGSKMLLLDNWNVWSEGHYIAPHREYGFGYHHRNGSAATGAS